VFAVIGALMGITPIAISSLVFGAVFAKGLAGLLEAGTLVAAVVTGLFSQFFLYYPFIISVFGRRNPFVYLANAAPAFVQAIGTSSSAAALPVSTKCAIEKNNIAPHIANFVISLGATIGMDGTAIYLITTIIWIGVQQSKMFSPADYITLAIMAALSAAGSAPIPNASLFLLQVISSSVGVEVNAEFLGIITSVDWALDRLRTCVNVAGDQTVSAIMDLKFGNGAKDNLNQEDIGMTDDKVSTFVFNTRRKSSMSLGGKSIIGDGEYAI